MLEKTVKKVKKNLFLVSNYGLLKEQFKKLNYKTSIVSTNFNLEHSSSNKIKIYKRKSKI